MPEMVQERHPTAGIIGEMELEKTVHPRTVRAKKREKENKCHTHAAFGAQTAVTTI